MTPKQLLCLWCVPLFCSPCLSQNLNGTEETSSPTRVGLSAGLGVSYVNAVDIVNRINSSLYSIGVTTERLADFNSAVEFYTALTVPIDKDWVAKLEYAYLLASYNVATIYPSSEFSVVTHMPTLIGQYVIVYHETYNVKAGFGLGYHFGSYVERYYTADATYSGSGFGAKLDLEANTAFGENLFAYLGGDLRWEFIGKLSNSQSPATNSEVLPTLHFFSIGAKLGFTYYF